MYLFPDRHSCQRSLPPPEPLPPAAAPPRLGATSWEVSQKLGQIDGKNEKTLEIS